MQQDDTEDQWAKQASSRRLGRMGAADDTKSQKDSEGSGCYRVGRATGKQEMGMGRTCGKEASGDMGLENHLMEEFFVGRPAERYGG